ncbi:hypothetical protein BS17DRAFT_769962 [Gyrodon lividus]|nr:hypothetical protein BS17DRAFT_769962 [Gyrodon lividus]
MNYAFNGRVDITQATTWDQNGILQLFNGIEADLNAGNNTYGVITTNGTNTSFPAVVKAINDLLKPPFPSILLPTPLAVNYQGATFNLETMFDLVGWIFSVTGANPANPDVTNYFYPLIVLYCHFCSKLASNGKQPQMVQITWFTQDGIGRVVLGSNLDRIKPTATKEEVRVRRAQKLVARQLAIDNDETHSNLINSNKAGHCAETFPILFINSLATRADPQPPILASCRGFAAKPAAVLDKVDKLVFPTEVGERQQMLADPCDDFCQQLIPRAGITTTQFSVDNL